MNKIEEYIETISKNYPNNIKNTTIKNYAIKYYKNKNITFEQAKKEIDNFLNSRIISEYNEAPIEIKTKSAVEELKEIDLKLEKLKEELAQFYKKNTN